MPGKRENAKGHKPQKFKVQLRALKAMDVWLVKKTHLTAFFFVETLALQRTATKRAPQRRSLFRSFFGKLGQRAAAGVDVFNSVRPAKKAFPVEVSKLLSGELAKVRAQERQGAFTVRLKVDVDGKPYRETFLSFQRGQFRDFIVGHRNGFGAGIVGHIGCFFHKKRPRCRRSHTQRTSGADSTTPADKHCGEPLRLEQDGRKTGSERMRRGRPSGFKGRAARASGVNRFSVGRYDVFGSLPSKSEASQATGRSETPPFPRASDTRGR